MALAPIVGGGLAAISGVLGNHIVNRIAHDEAQKEAFVSAMHNQHLSRAVASAVQFVILSCRNGSDDAALERLAKHARTYWSELCEHDDPRIRPYAVSQLPRRLTDYLTGAITDSEILVPVWVGILEEIIHEKNANIQISPLRINELAGALCRDFPQQIYVAFKTDLEHGGAAFGGIVLRLLCQVARDVQQLHMMESPTIGVTSLIHRFILLSDAVNKQASQVFSKLDTTTRKLLGELSNYADQMDKGFASVSEKVDESTNRIIEKIEQQSRVALTLPKLPCDTVGWPQPSPFHNRSFRQLKSFVGRDTVLDAIDCNLVPTEYAALTRPITLRGVGGVGKTRLAIEYARKHRCDYDLLLFINGETPETLRRSFAEAALLLNLSDQHNAKIDALFFLILRLLRSVKQALVVVDNADTQESVRAVTALMNEPGNTRWVITSRNPRWGNEFDVYPVPVLFPEEGVDLLQAVARRDGHHPGSNDAAAVVAKELGHLPLALQQAAAYVRYFRLEWTAYADLLEKNPAEALSEAIEELKEIPEGVLRTYGLSIGKIRGLGLMLISICVILAPSPLPDALFWPLEERKVRRALSELQDLSLLEWSRSQIEVHPSVAIAVRCTMPDSIKWGMTVKALELIEKFAPQNPTDPRGWQMWNFLDPHIESLLESINVDPWMYLVPFGLPVLDALPASLVARGRYVFAERIARKVLTIVQQLDLGKGPHSLRATKNLADALNHQGKYEEAEGEFRTILDILGSIVGEGDLNSARIRVELATSLDGQGKHVDAEKELLSALAIMERMLGPEDRDTLTARNNLALRLQQKGNYSEAEQEHRNLLEIRRRLFDETDPDIFESQINLAVALYVQGKFAEAEHECKRALAAFQPTLGQDHPDTLICRNVLGCALDAEAKYAEAEKEHRAVLAIRERLYGPNHPDVFQSSSNLALTLCKQGKFEESLLLLQQVNKGRT